MPLDTQRRHDGPDGSPIRCIINPLYQAVRFEPVGELGNVGPHALEAASKLAQGKRLACLHQRVECLELGRRKAYRLEGDFQLFLDTTRCLQERQHGAIIGTTSGLERVDPIFAGKIVHGMYYT